ncbi:MAG TPA: hypothetical protein HPP87_03095 [Planctomycetes bacterium]|nr:hypothetical protein [Planctomycetota bacterium]HIJ70332.1 hypothetical protein [Planctomycetota bacterium]
MATRRKQQAGPSQVIGAVSKFAGVLVGTAVVTGRRIIKTVSQPDQGRQAKPGKKSVQAPAGKKATGKTKGRKAEKKAAKKKETGPAGKAKTSPKTSEQSPAKKGKHRAKIS